MTVRFTVALLAPPARRRATNSAMRGLLIALSWVFGPICRINHARDASNVFRALPR